MSLDRLALILFCIVAFGGVGFWLASFILVSATLHPLLAVLPMGIAAIGAYFVIGVVRERVSNPEEDHYDRMEH